MQLGCSRVKPLSQKSFATYSFSYQETTLWNKDTQIASMNCGSLKNGIGGANSRRGCLSRGSVSHKGTPTSTLSKHSQRVLLHGNQVSFTNTITVTLIPLSTKELHQEKWGLHVPRTKLLTPLHTKSEGRWRCRRANKAPRGRRTEFFFWFTLKSDHKAQHLATSLTKELI